jgi:hypothetical protein
MISVLALSALAALMALDRASHRCLVEGGHFEVARWTCVPLPPIMLERDLRRS